MAAAMQELIFAKVNHPVRYPACTVDMVLVLADESLLSGSKFSDAVYISIFDNKSVNIYDGRTARIIVSETEITKLWK